MIPVYLSLFAVMTLGELLFAKGCSNAVDRAGRTGYALFMFFNGVVSCMFFATVSGFRLTCTPITLVFAALFAAVVLVSLLSTLCAYTIADIANVSVINSACTLLVTTFMGVWLFRESFDWNKGLRVVLMLTATFLVFWDTRKRKGTHARTNTKGALWKLAGLLCLLIVANGSSTILLKYFTQTPGVASENDFFFFTNVILIVVSAVWFWWEQRRSKQSFADCVQGIRPAHLLCYAGRTVSSNAVPV